MVKGKLTAFLPQLLVLSLLVLGGCVSPRPAVSSSTPDGSLPESTPTDEQNPSTPEVTPAASALSSTTPPSATPEPLPEHRIGVRVVDGEGEFFDRTTGETFVPRGANYVFVPFRGTLTNLLFKEGVYDPQRTREDFRTLAELGYNTVRVFLDHCSLGPGCITEPDELDLNRGYLKNIADMTRAAREAGLVILFTSNDLPDGGGYAEEANRGSGPDFAGYRNSYYLTEEAVSATQRYWRDLLTGLREQDAAFEAVLGWQLLNEQWMFIDQPPLSLDSGMVEITTGSYDLTDPAQKERMVSEGLIHYIGRVKEEILRHDPTALVAMGFFVPELVAPDWYVETASLLAGSDLDFFDFHAYPGEFSLEEHAESFGMIGYTRKPIILGEYGPFRHTYRDLESAARVSTEWTTASCQLGFDGWLYWAYYPAPASAGDRTWGLVEEDGYLLKLYAPRNQPDPCTAVDVPRSNLAYGKPVRASRSLPEEPPSRAVDDDPATQWGSGAGPIQWIEIDLEGLYRISEILLLVSQYPAGETVHRLQVRSTDREAYQTVHEFSGATAEGDWLVFAPEEPVLDVRQIRIQTVQSPSWVAWKEIEVSASAP